MKIFISHSNLDATIIDLFINSILIEGLFLNRDDIIFTGKDSEGLKTGDKFIPIIINHLRDSDYFFSMISKNYLDSVICQNELGAAWGLDKKIIPIRIDETPYNQTGPLLADSVIRYIGNDKQLDSIGKEIIKKLKLPDDNWKTAKNEFLQKFGNLISPEEAKKKIGDMLFVEKELAEIVWVIYSNLNRFAIKERSPALISKNTKIPKKKIYELITGRSDLFYLNMEEENYDILYGLKERPVKTLVKGLKLYS